MKLKSSEEELKALSFYQQKMVKKKTRYCLYISFYLLCVNIESFIFGYAMETQQLINLSDHPCQYLYFSLFSAKLSIALYFSPYLYDFDLLLSIKVVLLTLARASLNKVVT